MSALASNTAAGSFNAAVGSFALKNNTTGDDNTALGDAALYYNTIGSLNTAVGSWALKYNDTGNMNSAVGHGALQSNVDGYNNTAVGYTALESNTTGSFNTVVGAQALASSTTGGRNTAVGEDALSANTVGYNNTAVGEDALLFNTTGSYNTAIGNDALWNNTAGRGNIALGREAGLLTTGDYNILIGNNGVAGENRTIRIGNPIFHDATIIDVSSGTALTVDKSNNSGVILAAQNDADIEFRVDSSGNTYTDGTFSGGGADFAEMIAVGSGAETVEAGDVLVIDPANTRSVLRSSNPRSTLVAGIYSSEPGFLGSIQEWDAVDDEGRTVVFDRDDMTEMFGEIPMAVVGIVPCKVSAENGPIRIGDLLVTSSTPGHAMRDPRAEIGTVLGKALEAFGGGGTGVILVLVTLQ